MTPSADVTAATDVAAHARGAIASAPLDDDPGPHLVVSGVVPPSYYLRLLELMPPGTSFRYGDKHKSDFDPLTAATGPASSLDAWRQFEVSVVDGVLVPALAHKFAGAIGSYYHRRFGELADEVQRVPLRSRGGRLMLRRPGYRLKPHCDTQIAVITGLVYFARPGDEQAYGTQLYRVHGELEAPSLKTFYPEEAGFTCELARTVPFTPNTLLAFANGRAAHGASVPPDAQQTERYAYQFYIAPEEATLAAIVRRLPAERRARWEGLQG